MLVVRGDLDELTADNLEETLARIDGGTPVIVDLSETTFICSTSIRVLVRDRHYGRPALVAPEGNLTKVLGIVQADRTNRMFVDRRTAIQSLSFSRLGRTG